MRVFLELYWHPGDYLVSSRVTGTLRHVSKASRMNCTSRRRGKSGCLKNRDTSVIHFGSSTYTQNFYRTQKPLCISMNVSDCCILDVHHVGADNVSLHGIWPLFKPSTETEKVQRRITKNLIKLLNYEQISTTINKMSLNHITFSVELGTVPWKHISSHFWYFRPEEAALLTLRCSSVQWTWRQQIFLSRRIRIKLNSIFITIFYWMLFGLPLAWKVLDIVDWFSVFRLPPFFECGCTFILLSTKECEWSSRLLVHRWQSRNKYNNNISNFNEVICESAVLLCKTFSAGRSAAIPFEHS